MNRAGELNLSTAAAMELYLLKVNVIEFVQDGVVQSLTDRLAWQFDHDQNGSVGRLEKRCLSVMSPVTL